MPQKLGKAVETRQFWDIPVSRKQCAPKSWRMKKIPKERRLRICCPTGQYREGECKDGMFTGSVLYPKKRYNKTQAEANVKQFRR